MASRIVAKYEKENRSQDNGVLVKVEVESTYFEPLLMSFTVPFLVSLPLPLVYGMKYCKFFSR